MRIFEEKQYDVFVSGAGVAGIAAALQAARKGKKVAIAEKYATLGGMATTGHVNLFEPMCNGRGVQIIKGMAQELLETSIRYGYDDMPEEWQQGEPGYGHTGKRLMCRFSACIFSLTLCELLSNAGVEVLFDTVVTEVEHTGGHIDSVLIYNKSGFSRVKACMFVDATGDADLLWQLGVPTVTKGSYHTYAGWGLDLESCQKAVDAQDVAKVCFDIVGGNATRHGKRHPEGMPLWDGTDGKNVSEYFRMNQLELLENIKHQDRKSREIVMLPGMHQIRTTRRIEGNYTLTKADAYKHMPDSVGAIGDCLARDNLYEVPYGVLVRDGYDNVITAGRSTSGDDYGWELLRVIPTAILTGQAAGMACAIAIELGCGITEVPMEPLQKNLADSGVMIHFDDAWIPNT